MRNNDTVPPRGGQDQEFVSIVQQIIRLASTKDCPTVPPYLPEPDFVPLGYITIETALCLIGRVLSGDTWLDEDVKDGQLTLEEWRAWADEVEASPSIQECFKDLIPLKLIKAGGQRERWRAAVNCLLAFLHDEITHAMYLDESSGAKVGLATATWAKPVGRRVIETGTRTVTLSDGSVAEIRPVICLPPLEEALASIERRLSAKEQNQRPSERALAATGASEGAPSKSSDHARLEFWKAYVRAGEELGIRPSQPDNVKHANRYGVAMTHRQVKELRRDRKLTPSDWTKPGTRGGSGYDETALFEKLDRELEC